MKQKAVKNKEDNAVPLNWLAYKWPLILLATLIAFYNVLKLGFTNNDDVIFIINQHPYLSEWSNFFELFKHSVFQKNDTFYRPILMIYFMVMAHIAEPDNYFIYHLSLLLLHIANIFLVDTFFKKYIQANETRFWLTLLFSIHPTITMTVAWIPGVNDLLLTFFVLVYFNLFHSILIHKSQFVIRTILFSVLFFIILLTKETGLFLPFATSIVFIYNGDLKSNIKSIFTFISISLIGIFVWYFLRKNALGILDANTYSINTIEIFLSRIIGITFYISKVILPINLCVWPLWETTNYLMILISLLVFIALIVSNKNRNNKLIVFGFGWALIFLLPNFFSTTKIFVLHEHRLYLPLIGFLIVISESILFTHLISNVYRRLFFVCVAIFFIFQINNYIPSFNDAVSFNKSGINNSPNNAYLNNCYGVALSDANQSNEALPYFQKAYKLDTSLKNVRLYIARYDLIPNKKYDSAKILLLQEILKTPNNADNYYALSTIGFETKDYLFCEKYLEKYIQLRPDNIPIQQFAISIYSQNHHYSKANDLANRLKSNSIAIDEKLYQTIQDSLKLFNPKKDK